MNKEQITQRLGHITLLDNRDIVAGSTGTWTLLYQVGDYGIDSGGQLKIAFPLVTDWGSPQFDNPQASGYTTVTTNGHCKLAVSWQAKGYIRPWSKCIVIDIYAGSLNPSETITITLGDTQQGSAGIRAQTYVESKFEFRTLVDPTNANKPIRLPSSPQVKVIAGELHNLVCILPSQGLVNDVVPIFVKGEDKWGNPKRLDVSQVQMEWLGTGDVRIKDGFLSSEKAATGRLKVSYTPENSPHSFTNVSNPIEIQLRSPELKRFWGDLHAQTKRTVGTGDEDEYFTFARDMARLDFASHQGNDFQITDEYWQHINDTCAKYNQDEHFVVFPGYEWSGNSPAGGDHNVFYLNEGKPILRSSHWLVSEIPETDLSPAHPATTLYEKVKAHVPLDEVILAAHVGGRYANIRDYFDNELIALVEIVSAWGVFEWLLWDALERDYIVGIMCNSDGHHGRPGAESPGMAEFGIASGLTCVLAEALTRNSIFQALKNRHCYGTTGARILLDFSTTNAMMGDVITSDVKPTVFSASAIGSNSLESLQLFSGTKIIDETRPKLHIQAIESSHIRISWRGSQERGRQRRAIWDGAIHVSENHIERFELFAFDSLRDGVIHTNDHEITFKSATTGDTDGIDIWLRHPNQGIIEFKSSVGNTRIELEILTNENPRKVFDYGGIDMSLTIERYGYWQASDTLTLEHEVTPEANKLNPYFIKVIQEDGQMAWSSPIYVDTRK